MIRSLPLAVLILKLKSEDCRKLRSDVVRGEARNSAKQRQYPGAIICTRAIISLFVRKRYPLIPFVLNVAREQIATSAARAKPPCIPRRGLVVSIIKISGPSSVASFWISVENARQRKAKLNKTPLTAHRSLRRNYGRSIEQTKNDGRCSVD